MDHNGQTFAEISSFIILKVKLTFLDVRIINLIQIEPTTFHMLVKRSMDKFRRTGSMARKEGSGGSNSISRQAEARCSSLQFLTESML